MNETTQKIWGRYDAPVRQLVLWGRDGQKNPAFCILYGIQQAEKRGYNTYLLKDNVEYELYYIVKGQNGHFPSLPEVKAREKYHGGLELFYTRAKNSYYYRNKEDLVKESKSLNSKKIILPYYEEQPYSFLIQEIKKQFGRIPGFEFIENPNELLLFGQQYEKQFPKICGLFCNTNRYTRKKYLSELLDEKLPESFYEHLLNMASAELSAGIFLELAKRRDTMLVSIAEQWNEIKPFAEKNYMNGIERCIKIYLNSIEDKKRQEREKEIKKHLSEMDLHFHRTDNNESSDILEGEVYRRYANSGRLCPYEYKYVLENNRWVYKGILQAKHYKESIYCDGLVLNTIEVKNTLQEAEIYGLWDVIGTMAYYLDAPRLYYYLRANNGISARDYFRRYLRRVMNHYAQASPDTYIKIMKLLFSSYRKEDYISQYKGNFESNYFIAYYLYNRLPINHNRQDWEYCKETGNYIKINPLLKEEGRFEAYPEIWNQHLKETAEIAIISEVEEIVKACYFILRENIRSLETELKEEMIVALSSSFYPPLMKLGEELLARILENTEHIKPELLLALLKTTDEKLQRIAISYLRENEVPLELFVSLLFIKENRIWYPVWKDKILELSEDEMLVFIKELFEKKIEFEDWDIEDVADILHKKAFQTKEYSFANKEKIFSFFYSILWTTEKLPKTLLHIMQDTLFSIGKQELENILKNYSLDRDSREVTADNALILTVLMMLKNNQIPDSYQVSNLIEKGNSQMIHLLLEFLEQNTDILSERMELFLMFAESPVLLLNETAKKIFSQAGPEKRKEQLILLIGSPIERTYLWGLAEIEKEYENNIPKELFLKLMEHPSETVKAYIAEKSEHIIGELGSGNTDLFLYYVKTLLYLPNKTAKSKQFIYQKLPIFVKKYPDEVPKIEEILLDIGGSNCKKDSEQALVAIAKIRNEV